MSSQLQSLIEKIQTDGVAAADKKALEIIGTAKDKAKTLIQDANAQSSKIIQQAKDEAARTEAAGRKALEQAGRNLILALQKSITGLFERMMQKEIKSSLTADTMAAMLVKLIANWDKTRAGTPDLEVLVGKAEAQALTDSLVKKLQQEAKKGVAFTPVEGITAGFRIGIKGENMYYDFTEQGLAEMLSQYLNPKLAEILKGK